MTPQDALDAIVRALNQSSAFEGGDYLTEELDADGVNSRLEQPWVTLQPVSAVRADQWNTDLVGYKTDDVGNRVGRVFEAVFEMDVQADIWVAAGNQALDATSLGGDLAQALYQHDSQMVDAPFPADGGGTLDGIKHFSVGEGRRQDDLAGPGIRRWRHDLLIEFGDRVSTDEEYVAVVDTPTSGSATGGDDVAIELTPST